MRSSVPAALGLAVIALTARPAMASRESDALRARGATEINSLDRDQAVATFRQAIAADPQDAAAYRGLAGALWLSITYRRGNMTVDDYLGRVNRTNAAAPPPPAETAAAYRDEPPRRRRALSGGRRGRPARGVRRHRRRSRRRGLARREGGVRRTGK